MAGDLHEPKICKLPAQRAQLLDELREILRSRAIRLPRRIRLVNDLDTTVTIRDKCTVRVDLRPHFVVAQPVAHPRHAATYHTCYKPRRPIPDAIQENAHGPHS